MRNLIHNTSISGLDAAVLDHGTRPRELIYGLDMLRFVSAAWVAFSHGARFPIDRVISPDSIFHKILLVLGKTTFNGTAAVAVFFVISGFIIHNANMARVNLGVTSFLAKRLIRIIPPFFLILIIADVMGPAYSAAIDRIVWSVYCEIIYYLIYPLIRPLMARFGTIGVFFCSLLCSLAMLLYDPTMIYLWEYRTPLTWLFCAPLWLVGCVLAEHRGKITSLGTPYSVWWFRAGAIVYSLASTIIATHAGSIVVGYAWTIWAFGVFCVFWIAREMDHARSNGPNHSLERLGLGGYSIYLTHNIPITLFSIHLTPLPPFSYWVALLASISCLAWLYYRLIEWPCHLVARRTGKYCDTRWNR